MSSLCNIIKAENVNLIGKKVVRSFIDNQNKEDTSREESEEEIKKIEELIRLKQEEAEIRCQQIISDAQIESETLIEESKVEALNIEKKAYELGHSQGIKNGYEDGYKEVYEENIEKAKQEANEIIENANSLLLEVNNQVVNYMKENKANILNISISIAEQVLREKFEDASSMDNLILKVIEEYELKENVVIKVNPIYKESLDKQILGLKENYKVKGDIFVLSDESIEQGNAVIDKVNGRFFVGIDEVLHKAKEELL